MSINRRTFITGLVAVATSSVTQAQHIYGGLTSQAMGRTIDPALQGTSIPKIYDKLISSLGGIASQESFVINGRTTIIQFADTLALSGAKLRLIEHNSINAHIRYYRGNSASVDIEVGITSRLLKDYGNNSNVIAFVLAHEIAHYIMQDEHNEGMIDALGQQIAKNAGFQNTETCKFQREVFGGSNFPGFVDFNAMNRTNACSQ